VCNQTGSRDHVGSHAVSDVEENVLSLADFRQIFDIPVCCLRCTIVAESGLVLARLEEGYTTVGLGSDVDERRSLSILGEEVLVPVMYSLVLRLQLTLVSSSSSSSS
jgi:hypothetical protein